MKKTDRDYIPPIPTFTKEEDDYYQDLLTRVADEIGVPQIIDAGWLKSDERYRLTWYFIAQAIKDDPSIIDLCRSDLEHWMREGEPKYWQKKWSPILDQVQSGNYQILYERSSLMQQLRSKAPILSASRSGRLVTVTDKLRWKIIKFLQDRYVQ